MILERPYPPIETIEIQRVASGYIVTVFLNHPPRDTSEFDAFLQRYRTTDRVYAISTLQEVHDLLNVLDSSFA